MLDKVRRGFCIGVVGLLCLGYVASQYAYAAGQSAEYAAKVDVSPVNNLCLAIFLGAIILFAIPRVKES